MYSKIVLALDASKGAAMALPEAVALAKAGGGEVIVAHAVTHAREDSIEQVINGEVEQLRGAGLRVHVEKAAALVGEEADVIRRIASGNGADLIVIANRGRSPFKGALLGSVTQRLLADAPCPVLVVPGRD